MNFTTLSSCLILLGTIIIIINSCKTGNCDKCNIVKTINKSLCVIKNQLKCVVGNIVKF